MKSVVTSFILLVSVLEILAQNSVKNSIFQLFQTDDYLTISLESDFQNLIKNSHKDNYQPAKLSYVDGDGKTVNWDLEIKPRGMMRRRVCTMPPLKLKFQKSDLIENGLAKFKTLEMVEICKSTTTYEQYVLKEYVAYKLYNMLTDYSFKVQLVKIKFINTKSKSTPMDGFGFLIENNEEMAARLGGKIIEPESIGRRMPESQQKQLFCLFQYMIGNTDWWYATAHNLDIFCEKETITPIPIPYDFDYAGFVNTSYAVPNDKVPIKYVTDRYYQGPCMPWEITEQNLAIFLSKKEEMIQYCETFPYFSKQSKKSTVKYLKSFFDILSHTKIIKRTVANTCGEYD